MGIGHRVYKDGDPRAAILRIEIYGTGVTDLRPLQGMELGEFRFTPKSITQGLNLLRDMPSLKTIGIDSNQAWPAAEFWKRYDKGEFKVAFAPFTDADIKRIAALPAAEQVEEVRKELKKRNPDFGSIHARVTHKIEGDVVTEISIVGVAADKVTDISPVRALVGLKSFACGSGHHLSDLSPLKDMKLTYLRVTGAGVKDLLPLKDNTTLTTLDILGAPVSDLSPLKDNRTLTTLNLSLTGVTDLSPIKDTLLTSLSFGRTGVTDLSPLKDMKLTILRFNEGPVSDLSPLKDLKLTSLTFHNTPVSDLSPLKGMPLAELNCKSTKVTDLSPLKDLPLTNIECDFQPERDAEILRSIKTLEKINGKPAAEFWERYDKGEFKK